jgi:hypothetical protein
MRLFFPDSQFKHMPVKYLVSKSINQTGPVKMGEDTDPDRFLSLAIWRNEFSEKLEFNLLNRV